MNILPSNSRTYAMPAGRAFFAPKLPDGTYGPYEEIPRGAEDFVVTIESAPTAQHPQPPSMARP